MRPATALSLFTCVHEIKGRLIARQGPTSPGDDDAFVVCLRKGDFGTEAVWLPELLQSLRQVGQTGREADDTEGAKSISDEINSFAIQ